MMHSHQLDESNSRNVMLGYHTVLSDPVKGFEKKAPPPTGMVELFAEQIQTDVSHCNLFQWLSETFTLLRLRLSVYQSEIREINPHMTATRSIGAMGFEL